MSEQTTPRTTDDVLAGVDLSGRTALVTGATTGLGFETARALAAAGAHVVMTARTAEKGADAVARLRERVPEASVEAGVVELGSLASVRAFTDELSGRIDELHLLVANAGIMMPPLGRTEEGFELQFGTNHLGHFLLVSRLMPALLAGAPSRVVVLSSGGHQASGVDLEDPNYEHRPYAKMEAYGQSKTANVLFALELDRRYADRGVHAWSVHPGMVRTDLGRNFTKDDYAEMAGRAKSAGTSLPPLYEVEQGASTSVWAATAPELDDQGGAYLADCAVAPAAAHATDPEVAAKLWSLSEELVGEAFPTS
ncbi:SDR family NAD(P)-dependent oxidoreductase [Rhabdothermincola salaria]|uniref:SDR family NAD(P)-dependent oxidoreductase n=1 Tax=Rhabdothermincola salaria TaxID=2903142 RepID=UPI003211ADB5